MKLCRRPDQGSAPGTICLIGCVLFDKNPSFIVMSRAGTLCIKKLKNMYAFMHEKKAKYALNICIKNQFFNQNFTKKYHTD